MVPLDKQATTLVCCTHRFYSRIYIKGINRTEKGRPMRKRMRRCLIALLLVLALTGSAFAAQYTAGTFEELEAAFADDSGDKEIHITLTGDIAFAGKLSAQEGKTFYIDGKAFTLKDVYLGGAGTVNVEAKSFEADSNDDAIRTADSVTVNAAGSVTTDGDHDGIQADDSSNLTFTGDIKAGYDGAEAFDDAKVTVNGSITAGENGVRARDNGSVTVSPKSTSSGRTVTITVKADEGYELDELTVTDKNGDEIKLTDKGDGKYTFKMPRSKVTIEASFVEIDHQDTCPAAGFRDVDEDAWYHEAVDYALDNGLMSGVSDREFAPGSTLTRAMVAQMLYSLEGKPAAGRADFADVAEGAWYADAISWAAGEGIVSGYGDTFGPNDPITREQLAAILYRYAQNEGYKTSQSGKGTEGYLDASSISSYAVKAMDWAVNAGLLSGKGNNTLAPTAGATRAEVAQIFMNFCENIAK